MDGPDSSPREYRVSFLGLAVCRVQFPEGGAQGAPGGGARPWGEEGEGALREPARHALPAQGLLDTGKDLDEEKPGGMGTRVREVAAEGIPETGATDCV